MPEIDLRLDANMRDRLKTRRLRRRVGDHGVLCLIWIWAYCAVHHPEDGILRGQTPEEIEETAGWSGDPGVLFEALTSKGTTYLEETREGWKCHDWERRQPWLAGSGRRSEAARKAAISKHEKRRKSGGSCGPSAGRMRGASGAHAGRSAPSPSPSPSPSPFPAPTQEQEKAIGPDGPPAFELTPVNAEEERSRRAKEANEARLRTAREWMAEFPDFWTVYPRKAKRERALERWRQVGVKYLGPRKLSVDELRGNVMAILRARIREWKERPPDRVPHASTFLGDESFGNDAAVEALEEIAR